MERPDPIVDQMVFLADELNYRYPELDLRFTLPEGSSTLMLRAAAISDDPIELELGACDPQHILYDAMFQIKELARYFDS